MTNAIELGKIIANKRKKRKITQATVAEAIDVSQAHFSSIETGRDNPSLKLLNKIADALNCELYIDLLSAGEEPRTDQSLQAELTPQSVPGGKISPADTQALLLRDRIREKIEVLDEGAQETIAKAAREILAIIAQQQNKKTEDQAAG